VLTALNLIRVLWPLYENRDDFLVCGDEALEPALVEIDDFVGLDDAVVAVDELGDQFECTWLLVDSGEQQFAFRILRLEANALVIYLGHEALAVRNFLSPFRHPGNIDFARPASRGACVCGQFFPAKLLRVFSRHLNLQDITT